MESSRVRTLLGHDDGGCEQIYTEQLYGVHDSKPMTAVGEGESEEEMATSHTSQYNADAIGQHPNGYCIISKRGTLTVYRRQLMFLCTWNLTMT